MALGFVLADSCSACRIADLILLAQKGENDQKIGTQGYEKVFSAINVLLLVFLSLTYINGSLTGINCISIGFI